MSSIVKVLKDSGWGPVRLAEKLNIRPQAISQWTLVPADRVLRVEELTGVSRHMLNPVVFGHPKPKRQKAGAAV